MLFLKGTFGEVQLATYGIIFQWTALVYMVRIKLFLACISATPGRKKKSEKTSECLAVDNHVPLHKLFTKCLLHLKIILWHNLRSLSPISGSSGIDSKPGWEQNIVFLGKILYCHSASLNPEL